MSVVACVDFGSVNNISHVKRRFEFDICDVSAENFSGDLEKFNDVDLILLACDSKKSDLFLSVRQIKKFNPSIPIILVVNEHLASIALQALRFRVLDVVCLPDEIDYLNERVNEFLRFMCNSTKSISREIFSLSREPHDDFLNKENTLKTNLAITYIGNHYNRSLRIKELADVCCMSQSKFSKCFKIEQGCTARDYITNYRVSVAKILLKQTASSVDKVAYESGFETVALFNRLFLKTVGYTPSQYRAVL